MFSYKNFGFKINIYWFYSFNSWGSCTSSGFLDVVLMLVKAPKNIIHSYYATKWTYYMYHLINCNKYECFATSWW